MDIALKSIKFYERMSEETNCYDASLYVDGVRIGRVSNRGQGGCDDFYGDRAAYDRADAWCRANLPQRSYNMGDGVTTYAPSLEDVCGDLLSDHLALLELRKVLRKKTMFSLPGEEGFSVLGYKGGKPAPDTRLYDEVRQRHPGAVILNEMPEAEALHAYRMRVDPDYAAQKAPKEEAPAPDGPGM